VGLLGQRRGPLVADLGDQRGDLHQRALHEVGSLGRRLGAHEALVDEDA
jgi:hypothetical protein